MAENSTSSKLVEKPIEHSEASFGAFEGSSDLKLTIQSINVQAVLKSELYPEDVQILVECLVDSPIGPAFTCFGEVPLRLVTKAYKSAFKHPTEDKVIFDVEGSPDLTQVFVTKSSFRKYLGLPEKSKYVTPSSQQLVVMFNEMGYDPPLEKLSAFKKKYLPPFWGFLFTLFRKCLTGRKSGIISH